MIENCQSNVGVGKVRKQTVGVDLYRFMALRKKIRCTVLLVGNGMGKKAFTFSK